MVVLGAKLGRDKAEENSLMGIPEYFLSGFQ